MRTNKNLKKSTIAKFAGLLVIALCFALTFTLTLTLNPIGGVASAASSHTGATDFGNVNKDRNTAMHSRFGALGSIEGVSGELNESHFGFSGMGTANIWSKTETFNKGISTADNHQVFSLLDKNNDAGNDDKMYRYYGGSDYIFKFGTYAGGWGSTSDSYAMITYYKVGAALQEFIDNPNFSVKVNATANLYVSGKGTNYYYFGIKGQDANTYDAQDACERFIGLKAAASSDNENIAFNNDPGDGKSWDANCGDISLTPGTRNISIAVGSYFGRQWGVIGYSTLDRYIQVNSLSLTFTISYNYGADREDLLINDGSLPVKVAESLKDSMDWSNDGFGQISSNIIEKYVPYHYTANSGMPVYYDSIASYLATDKKTASGDANLNSYISRATGEVPFGNASAKQYRKMAAIEFADTYDLKALDTDDQFDASKGSADYLTHAGIAGYTYKNGKWVKDTDALNKGFTEYYASGIREIVINVQATQEGFSSYEKTIKMYEGFSNGEKVVQLIEGEDKNDNPKYMGWIRVIKNSRANATVELYLNHNADVTITVYDFGGALVENKDDQGNVTSTSITRGQGTRSVTSFKGIDTVAPSAANCGGEATELEYDSVIAATTDNFANVLWFKTPDFTSGASSGADSDADGAPHVWFYTVQKRNTIDDLKRLDPYDITNYFGSDRNTIQGEGMSPIAVGAFTSFRYDFKEGYAYGPDGKPVVNAFNLEGQTTGAGYYRFTFYKCDLAGNLGEIVSQYVKVDYDAISYDVKFDYKGNTEGQLNITETNIGNVRWAIDEATLTITTGVNFSGNTFMFNDTENEFILTFDRDGNFALYKGNECVGRGSNENSIITAIIQSDIDETEIYIKYKKEIKNSAMVGTITITFEGANEKGEFPTVAWQTGMNMYISAYNNLSALEDDELKVSEGKPLSYIFIDRNDPECPTYEDEDNGFVIKATDDEDNFVFDLQNKIWMTSGYNLKGTLSFTDLMGDNPTFAPYITVYAGYKFINSIDQFYDMDGKMKAAYEKITTGGDADGLLDRLYTTSLNKLGNESASYKFSFSPDNGSGMRLIYFWVKDQAGRLSDIYSCYVLIDNTKYNVNAQLLKFVDGKDYGKLSVTKENGNAATASTAFNRGETIKINVTLNSGYVPYKFDYFRGNADNATDEDWMNLLLNKTPEQIMEILGGVDGKFKEFVSFEPLGDNQYSISFKLDDNDILTALADDEEGKTGTIANFKMSARKVITSIPNSTKYYDGQLLDMSKHVTLNDANALQYLKFTYYDSIRNEVQDGDKTKVVYTEGNKRTANPRNQGTYFVLTQMNDNDFYVLDYNDSQNKAYVSTMFTILKGRVIITPIATTSVYGDVIKLEYTVSGFNESQYDKLVASEQSLRLSGYEYAALAGKISIPVGTYEIIQNIKFDVVDSNGKKSDNYDIEFTPYIRHTVKQREVNVSVFEESKQWGDRDGAIRFSVDPTQFAWYGQDVKGLLGTIFNGYGDVQLNDDGLYLVDSKGRIKRVGGENVGTYAYELNGTIDVNNNYIVKLSLADKKFTITQRKVTITANDLSTTIKYSNYVNNDYLTNLIAEIARNFNYTVSSADVLFASDIAKAVAGKFTLTANGGLIGGIGDEYEGYLEYTVLLAEENKVETKNIVITLETTGYRVYVSAAGTVIITLKNGVNFDFTYGKKLTEKLISYSSDKFDYECDDESVFFTDVEWTFSFRGATMGTCPNAGTYSVTFSNAKIKNGNNVLANKVIVNGFNVTVNPAVLTVEPNQNNNLTKIYGNADNELGFMLTKVNGKEFGEGQIYDETADENGKNGLYWIDIYRAIVGSFARGYYNESGTFVRIGTQYDDVTDVAGNILTTNASGNVVLAGGYYSYMISSEFAYGANNNFVVKAELPTNARFIINPKEIELNVKNFIGVNKVYDGSTSVNFGDAIAYNLSSLLARPSDDLRITFKAAYTEAGKDKEATPVGIIFTELGLAGAQSHNYVLFSIENNDHRGDNRLTTEDAPENDKQAYIEFKEGVKVKVYIYYLNNSVDINNRIHIEIKAGWIGIHKDDITVQKVYDGKDDLNANHISIKSSNADEIDSGTKILAQLLANGQVKVTTDHFPGVNAGNYTLETLVLEFAMVVDGVEDGKNPWNDYNIKLDGEYLNADISYERPDNTNILRITISNMPAAIKQRVFGVDSFTSIKPLDQDYRGQHKEGDNKHLIDVTEAYLKSGQVVAEDSALFEFKLVAYIDDTNYDVGVHPVKFAPMDENTSGERHPVDKSWTSNPNYTIDIDALNEVERAVTINPAKLRPNVKFVDREYNGGTDVETMPFDSDYEYDFITEQFTAELEEELKYFEMVGTVEYSLSDKGKDNPNVIVDENGNVVAHNVFVKGLQINVKDNNTDLLKNYELSGGRYDEATDKYKTVEVGTQGISKYELLGAVNITRRTVEISANNVIVRDKIYDGNDVATVDITLEEGGTAEDHNIAEGHGKYIQATAKGKFVKVTAGNNIDVVISDVALSLKDSVDEDNKDIINNYVLAHFSERRPANIIPRPVTFDVNLGEQTYNGATEISIREIAFDIKPDTMLNNEKVGYVVRTLQGYSHYVDKNVIRGEKGENDKEAPILKKNGFVFNPELVNMRGGVNYQLAYSSETPIAGKKTLAYTLDGLMYAGEAPSGSNVITYYYALDSIEKYIEINEGNKDIIKQLSDAGAIIDTIKIDNMGGVNDEKKSVNIHVINPDYKTEDAAQLAAIKTLSSAYTYVRGEGKIEPKVVSISSQNITVTNKDILTKMYDGTTKCFGEFGTDFEYTTGGILGIIEGDHVKVKTVVAEFENASTNARYVKFTPDEIESTDGSNDADNYTVNSKLGYATFPAEITKRPIEVNLPDDTIEYGTSLNSLTGNVTYSIQGNAKSGDTSTQQDEQDGDKKDDDDNLLIAWENNLYMQYGKYTDTMGIGIGNYEHPLRRRMYRINNADGTLRGFDKLTEDEANEADPNDEHIYIQLSGIMSLPKVKANFGGVTVPEAGSVAESYTVTNVNVNNYEFVPKYTDMKNKTSKLTVVRKDLYVSTNGANYTKEYAGNNPSVELYFSDKNGNWGFAASDNAYNVFFKNGGNYAPIVKWGVYDYEEQKFTPYTDEQFKYAKICGINEEGSDKYLGVGKIYVPYLELVDGWEENVKNYNLIVNNIEGYELMEREGTEGNTEIDYLKKYVIKMTYEGEGIDLKTTSSTLTITQPTMGGVTLRGADNNIFNYTYDGTNHLRKVLIGVNDATDTVTFGNGLNATKAGSYTGIITVTRDIKVDANDKNGYSNLWTSGSEVTINVAKASPQLAAVSTSKYYDGNSFVYEVTGGNSMISYLNAEGLKVKDNYVDISYEMLGKDNQYVPVAEMRNAGTYRVIVSFNNAFEAANENYKAETVVATYTILKAVVSVSISSEGYNATTGSKNNVGKTLVAEYDSSKDKYEIKYTISNMASTPDQLKLPISQTELVFEKDIVSAGRYPFAVKITEGDLDMNNYRLENEKGVLELTTKSVASSNASVEVENAAVINKLVSKELTQGKGNGSDIELWSKINEYMPAVDKQAKLASVVRLGLYCDDVLVEYNGSITVSVAVPENVGDLSGKAIYTVTRNGGLKRLENYTVSDGKIVYTTDYLGALVFVDFKADTLPTWQIVLIALAVVLFVAVVVWTVVAFIVRKSKLKKLA